MIEKPRVDKNIELLSMVFRLAGSWEYNLSEFKIYTDAIDARFTDFKDHEMVLFAGDLRSEHGIGFNAIPSIALCLDEELNFRKDLADGWPDDRRWDAVDKEKFVALLKQFAVDSDFESFWNENATLYADVETNSTALYEALDVEWFSRFFGVETTDYFRIVIGTLNGPCNYASGVNTTDGPREVYAIIGVGATDENGMALFRVNDYISTLVHEFNHSFCNPLNERHADALKSSAKALFDANAEHFRKQAYGAPEYVMNEALVRAATIKYLRDHDYDDDFVDNITEYELNFGFTWINELIAELEKYDSLRDEYPTLDDYMPRIAEAYKIWAEKYD